MPSLDKNLIINHEEIFATIPDSQKTGFYYTVISLFIISTIVATLLSGAFLLLSFILWSHFKTMKFFWFLTQLNVSVFVLSVINLFVNVPATLHLLSRDVGSSDMYAYLTYLLDFCHYSILFSNLVIGLQRGFVFLLDTYAENVFKKPYIYIWLTSSWVFPLVTEYFLIVYGCVYKYDSNARVIVLECLTDIRSSLTLHLATPTGIQIIDSTLHIVIPTFLFWIYLAIIVKIMKNKRNPTNRHEILILKQAVFVFVAFQSSSLVLLSAQYFRITEVDAFLIKRFVNTMEIFAGAATPSFFFFTSKEVRRLVTTRVTVSSSQTGSNVQVRGV